MPTATYVQLRHDAVPGTGALGYVIIGLFALAWIVSIRFYRWMRFDELEIGLLKDVSPRALQIGWSFGAVCCYAFSKAACAGCISRRDV